MARQDSRHRGPEEIRDAYRLKASIAMTDWPCYKMPDKRHPKTVFFRELQEEKRSRGGQKKRYKDTLKASLKDFEIPMGTWE